MNKINKCYKFEHQVKLSNFMYFFKFELYSKNEIRSDRPSTIQKRNIQTKGRESGVCTMKKGEVLED